MSGEGKEETKRLVVTPSTDAFEFGFAAEGEQRIELTMKEILPSDKSGGKSGVRVKIADGSLHASCTSPLPLSTAASGEKRCIECPAYVHNWPACPDEDYFEILLKRKGRQVLARATVRHPLVPYGDVIDYAVFSECKGGGAFVLRFFGERDDKATVTRVTFDPTIVTEDDFDRVIAPAREKQETECEEAEGTSENSPAEGTLAYELGDEEYEMDYIARVLSDILDNDQICVFSRIGGVSTDPFTDKSSAEMEEGEDGGVESFTHSSSSSSSPFSSSSSSSSFSSSSSVTPLSSSAAPLFTPPSPAFSHLFVK